MPVQSSRLPRPCPGCGKTFRPRHAPTQSGFTTYCSRTCWRTHAVKVPLAERFWSKANRSTADACWEWQAGCTKTGYGEFGVSGKMLRAHRVAWEIVNGPIPPAVDVCHRCDNRRCVNPDHLFLGTRSDNMRDCAAKGRVRGAVEPGERHSSAKLTEAQVLTILADNVSSHVELGLRYGVKKHHIYAIRVGKKWRHLGGNPHFSRSRGTA